MVIYTPILLVGLAASLFAFILWVNRKDEPTTRRIVKPSTGRVARPTTERISRKAFTLIEAMLVVAILASILAMVVPFLVATNKANKAATANPSHHDWKNLGTIPSRTELIVLPTGERLFVIESYRGLHATLLPPLPTDVESKP